MEQPSTRRGKVSHIIGYSFLWLFYLYLYIQILSFNQGNVTNLLLSGLYLVLFGVHEISHLVFSFLPNILTAGAGSISEIVFTSTIVVVAYRAKSYWAMIFGVLWLMMALASTGNYMADASAQSMPLMGPGTDLIHDWNFVFGKLGWLDACEAIGKTMKVIGWIIGAGGLLMGLLLIFALIKPVTVNAKS